MSFFTKNIQYLSNQHSFMCVLSSHIHTYLPDDNESISQVNAMSTHTKVELIYLDLDLRDHHKP